MPDTGGYSSRKTGWRTSLQGKQRLVRSVINGSGKRLGAIPCGIDWAKGRIFFSVPKRGRYCWTFFTQRLHLPQLHTQAWSGTTLYLSPSPGVVASLLRGKSCFLLHTLEELFSPFTDCFAEVQSPALCSVVKGY